MAFNLDQSYTTGQDNDDATQELRRASNNTEIIGQSFTPTLSGALNRFEFDIKRIGTPSGNIWVEIHADGANPTVTTQQGSNSATVSAGGVSTTYGYVSFDFATPISLSPGVKYWALLVGDYTLSTTNGIVVATDTTSPTYTSGNAGRYGNGSAAWEDIPSYDCLFKQYSDDAPATGIAFISS